MLHHRRPVSRGGTESFIGRWSHGENELAARRDVIVGNPIARQGPAI